MKRYLILAISILLTISKAYGETPKTVLTKQKSSVVLVDNNPFLINSPQEIDYEANNQLAKKIRAQRTAILIGGYATYGIVAAGTIFGAAILATNSDTPALIMLGSAGLVFGEAFIASSIIGPIAARKAAEAERLTTYSLGSVSHNFDSGASISSSLVLFDNKQNNKHIGLGLTYSF